MLPISRNANGASIPPIGAEGRKALSDDRTPTSSLRSTEHGHQARSSAIYRATRAHVRES